MIRPISLILAIVLSAATVQTLGNFRVTGNSVLLLVLMLWLVPLVATIVVIPLSKSKVAKRVAIATIVASWIIAMLQGQWLEHVRLYTGNIILLDEIIAVAPPILYMSIVWWFTSPIQSKRSWVFHKVRFEILVLLLFVLVLMGLEEFEEQYVHFGWYWLVIFVLFYTSIPFYFLAILPTSTMPTTDSKEEILAAAKVAGIKKANIYVLDTHFQMLNALAYGLLFQRKFVLFTDKLLRDLTRNEVVAIARHEFAHLKYGHVTFCWLTLVCVTLWVFYLASFLQLEFGYYSLLALKWGVAIVSFVLVTRQFEIQADTYAVVESARLNGDDVVTNEAISSMRSALHVLAFLNGQRTDQRDVLHGSIEKRIGYLQSLVGKPLHKIPINKRVRCIKLGILALLVLRFVV